MRPRYARKTDQNQAQIIAALRAIGAQVTYSSEGNGHPDLIVNHHGKTYYFDVKNPKAYGKKKKLSESQSLWMTRTGNHVSVVTTSAQAYAILGISTFELKPRKYKNQYVDAKEVKG